MAYLDSDTVTLDFSGPILVLDSNPSITVSGNTVTMTDVTGPLDDSIAVQITGTFGPGTTITFDYTTTPIGDTAAISYAKAGGVSGSREPE